MSVLRKRQPQLHVGRPAGNGPELIPALVADPYPDEKGEHRPLAVMRNARSSPIHHLFERGRLGSREEGGPRVLASVAFQRTYERAQIGGSKGVDYESPKVDTSFVYRGLADATISAVRELTVIRDALGRNYDVVEKIAGHGMSLRHYASSHYDGHPAPGRARIHFTKRLIMGLDDLIEYYGVARGPVRNRACVARSA